MMIDMRYQLKPINQYFPAKTFSKIDKPTYNETAVTIQRLDTDKIINKTVRTNNGFSPTPENKQAKEQLIHILVETDQVLLKLLILR